MNTTPSKKLEQEAIDFLAWVHTKAEDEAAVLAIYPPAFGRIVRAHVAFMEETAAALVEEERVGPSALSAAFAEACLEESMRCLHLAARTMEDDHPGLADHCRANAETIWILQEAVNHV